MTVCVLCAGSALMYFRDPGSENSGLLDGIIDLGLVQKVS
jgi:hypothetical protein